MTVDTHNPIDLLTPAETAELLKVKLQTLSAWRCSGRHDLPFQKVGGSVRYRRADVTGWLNGRMHTSTATV
jgi:excisionase family DNA binding protein